MAFKMKGFSGFKQTNGKKRTKMVKDPLSPAGFEAIKNYNYLQSYAEPGGDPAEYRRRAIRGRKEQDAINRKKQEKLNKALMDIEIDYSQGVKSGKYKNPYKK